MNDNKKALGKGLSALISDKTIAMLQNNNMRNQYNGDLPNDVVVDLPINDIRPNENQPRKVIAEIELKELSDSILKHGILQPILVKKLDRNKYQVIAGERRWRAAKIANFISIPSIIKNADEKTLFEISIIENIQRENLRPIEEAASYKKLIENFGYTQDDLALRLGKSRSHVTNMLRLLKLPKQVQDMMMENKLSVGHARAIINANNPIAIAAKVINENLNVRQTEILTQSERQKASSIKFKDSNTLIAQIDDLLSAATSDQDLKQLEDSICAHSQMSAKIITHEMTNYIILRTNDFADLDSLLEVLSKR